MGFAWCSGACCYRGWNFLIGTVVVGGELGCTMVVVAAVAGAAVVVPWCFVQQWSVYCLSDWLLCSFVAVFDMLINVLVIVVVVAPE